MNVQLTPSELRQAADAGCLRRIRALRIERQATYGDPDQELWGLDIEAAAAEMAVAKALGIYWTGTAMLDYDGDVGALHVRHTRLASGGLILHDRDPDDGIFVLVIGSMGVYRLAGWIKARDGKIPEYHSNGKLPRPAFLVPQRSLAPIEGLPRG